MNLNDIKKMLADRTALGRWLYQRYKSYRGRERHVSLGDDNPNKTFYLIGYEDLSGGLFWLVNKAIMHIAYALDHGYIPVIDYKSHRTQYTETNDTGKQNIWEVYFKQPAGYSLDDISKSRNIIINRQEPAPEPQYLMGQYEFYDNVKRIEYFRNIFKKHIIYNDTTAEYLRDIHEKCFKGRGRIIGVLCRGTDYVAIKPKGHPVQPAPSDVIKDVRKAMSDYKYDSVFLATEDADIVTMFHEAFGDSLICLEQERIHGKEMDGKNYLAQEKDRHLTNRNRHNDALSYLAAIYLLAHCNCFFGGRTGGTKGVLLMSDGFEHSKIYDLGLYS
jgi:hypothetical protein